MHRLDGYASDGLEHQASFLAACTPPFAKDAAGLDAGRCATPGPDTRGCPAGRCHAPRGPAFARPAMPVAGGRSVAMVSAGAVHARNGTSRAVGVGQAGPSTNTVPPPAARRSG